MLKFYLLIDAATVILLLTLMALTLSGGGHKNRLNRLFAYFAVTVSIWLPANHIGNNLNISPEVATLANHLVFGTSFISAILLAKIITKISDSSLGRSVMRVCEWFLWPFALLSFTPLVGAGVERQDNVYGVIFGPLGGVYGILLVLFIVFITAIISRGLLKLKGFPLRRLQAVGAASVIVVPMVMLFSFVLPVTTGIFAFTEFGLTPIVIFVAIMYYSVIRHRLFDVRLAAMRTFTYTLLVVVLASIYFVLAYLLSAIILKSDTSASASIDPANIVLALILAFLFQPIKQFFDQLTNQIFYRGRYDSGSFLRGLGKILSFDTDLRALLGSAGRYIGENLKSEQVFFYIKGRGIYGAYGTRKSVFPDEDLDILVEYYKKYHELPDAMVAGSVVDESVEKLLASHKAVIALPLILQENVIGCLFVGEHKGRGYTSHDVRVLESISNELTIAVQNSLSVEAIRDLNETLQRRVDEATKELRASNRQLQRLDEAKNEFISMASHQLRTPLTSIKGYLDMMLEGDLGKISSTQRAVLSEAFLSSERMVILINDFLNVSRLQTGKFTIERHESDLAATVSEQASMLTVFAKQHDVKLDVKISKDLPTMSVDIDKLRQVVLNMMDNAIFYSKPGTTAKIRLEKHGGSVTFTVKDTGIGVPQDEQSGLFGKFFRASNARKRRPDGTGIGLFLAKKIVLAHGGEIIFESTEGKGSTFGFTIPIR